MLKNLIPLFKYNLLDDDGGDGGGGAPPTNPPKETPAPSEPPPSEPPKETPAPVNTDWDSLKQSLPEELRDNPSLKPVTNLETLVKNYVHAQKQIGKDKITLPDKHATDEDWQHVFRKLGVPEKAEEYDFNHGLKEENEFLKSFKAKAHEAGILPHQAEKIFGFFKNTSESTLQAQTEKYEQERAEAEANLKKEWGEAYNDNLVKSRVAFKELVPDEAARQQILEAGLGDNPAFIKMLNKASEFFKEDVFVGHGAGQFSSMSPSEALNEAQRIQGDPKHPYRDKAHPNHKAAKEEVQRLYKIAYPN